MKIKIVQTVLERSFFFFSFVLENYRFFISLLIHRSFFSERRHRSRKTFFVLKHFVRSQKRCPSLPEMLVQALHI